MGERHACTNNGGQKGKRLRLLIEIRECVISTISVSIQW